MINPNLISDPSSQQAFQQAFSQLSNKFKKPLRDLMFDTNEAVLNGITHLLQQLITGQMQMQELTKENSRLRKLLEDNKIDFTPKIPQPNRAERRAAEKKKN